MPDNISKIRNFMFAQEIDYLLVNSTNEFLVEYNTLDENSRYKLTNFSGSTGDVLVTAKNLYLFVDGRYHIQADLEVNHDLITVVKLKTGENFLSELIKMIPENKILGVFSKKLSQKQFEFLSSKLPLKQLKDDPLDDAISVEFSNNIILNPALTGFNTDEKINRIKSYLSEGEAFYFTDSDEVSYLFNMRNFSQPYSAKVRAKCLVTKDKTIIFSGENLKTVPDILKKLDLKVFVDKSSINAYDYSLLKHPAALKNNPVKIIKAKKNDAELTHLKDAFARTDKAVFAIKNYIEKNNNLSEFDIAQQLEKEFKKQGALGLSFKSIVAKDKNSALAHYSKSSKDEIINDGSLILIDCGAYFEGGLATDITRVFVKGEPSDLHRYIYTLVLRAFLNAYNYGKTHSKRPLTGYEIDSFVHEFFDKNDTKGFVFNHGLGHGIGINVHEYPPNLSQNEIAKVEIEDGMCFSIEPGLYKEGEFGVRLENSCYYKNGQIHSFVKMNYENKLINYDMLTVQEKVWLKEFEVK